MVGLLPNVCNGLLEGKSGYVAPAAARTCSSERIPALCGAEDKLRAGARVATEAPRCQSYDIRRLGPSTVQPERGAADTGDTLMPTAPWRPRT